MVKGILILIYLFIVTETYSQLGDDGKTPNAKEEEKKVITVPSKGSVDFGIKSEIHSSLTGEFNSTMIIYGLGLFVRFETRSGFFFQPEATNVKFTLNNFPNRYGQIFKESTTELLFPLLLGQRIKRFRIVTGPIIQIASMYNKSSVSFTFGGGVDLNRFMLQLRFMTSKDPLFNMDYSLGSFHLGYRITK